MEQLIKLNLDRSEYKLINSEEQVIKVWKKDEFTREKLKNYIDELKKVSLTEVKFIDETKIKYLDVLTEEEKEIFINDSSQYFGNLKINDFLYILVYLLDGKNPTEEIINTALKMYSLGYLRGMKKGKRQQSKGAKANDKRAKI